MRADLIDHTNAALFESQLSAFFAARHDIYVEELTWRPPAVDGLERDPFDTLAATYLVVTDENRLVAGSRLVPTSEPHLASEYFAETLNRAPLPREADIVEWTRGFIVAGRRERGGMRLKAYCCAAVMEYCLAARMRRVGGMQDVRWLSLWRRMGWRAHIYGDPMEIDGRSWLPAYCDVTEEAMMGARQRAGVTGSILHA